MFDFLDTPAPKTPADHLARAVERKDHSAAVLLLEAANGACPARKLVEDAEAHFNRGPLIKHSIVLDGDKETLMMYRLSGQTPVPFAGITQKRCEK